MTTSRYGIAMSALLVSASWTLPVSAAGESPQPLRDIVSPDVMRVGGALMTDHLEDPITRDTFVRHFNQLTPENEMKWSFIHPEQERYDFTAGDQLVAFAEQHGMVVKGHTLVWHIQNPDWLEKGDFSADEMDAIMKDHIHTVVGHYKGKVKYWDVVNEALNDTGGWRDTIWYQAMGEDYIAKAFRYAHEADPDAILFYNDYSTEAMNPKSNATYRLVKGLVDQGVPVHGVGTQLHLMGDQRLSTKRISENIQRYDDLGLKFHFTEIDVRIQGETASESQLRDQGALYHTLMNLALYHDNVDMITTWGVTDRFSWIPHWFHNYDHGLMFDKEGQPKPAYEGFRDSLVAYKTEQFAFAPAGSEGQAVRHFLPFFAQESKQPMTLLGDSAQWQDTTFYPFAFNQITPRDMTLPDETDLSGRFALAYHGNTLFGRVERQDDITFISNKEQTWENDNVEVFLQVGDYFVQLRALVGQDFEPHNFPGKVTSKWNEDGSLFDFAIEFPRGSFPGVDELAGQTLGFNIALADNDGEGRTAQLYPVPGYNMSYQGEDLAELFFPAQNREVAGDLKGMVVPFKAARLSKAPDLDKPYNPADWADTIHYPFGFNQLKKNDMSLPAQTSIQGSWRVGYKDNWLYGVIYRQDDTNVTTHEQPWENDNAEVFVEVNGEFAQLRSVIWEDFAKHPFPGNHKAVWNDDADVMMFAVELPLEVLAGQRIGFNLSLSNNDNGLMRDSQLYPVPGFNQSYLGDDLTILEFSR